MTVALLIALPTLAQDEVDVESLQPGHLGFGFNYRTDEDRAAHQGWLRVCGVAPGSPAEQAGLAVDDIITEMDGKPFVETRYSDVLTRMARVGPGQTVSFAVHRGPKTLTIAVTAGPTTSEHLERWRQNFLAARFLEARMQN